MFRLAGAFALIALIPLAAFAQHGDAAAPEAATPPPLYDNLGTWSHKITTSSAQAQRYFDQGLRLTYGFNHEEASRAFREAARLDPRCPMAWWGVALVAGPNINLPMDEDHRLIANEAIARAVELQARGSEAERSYIAALSRRYSTDAKASRAGLDSAYANAMTAHAARYPNDADAAVMSVESRLDLNPWNQWTMEGKPTPGTVELVADLETVLKRWPNHPGALHYYIHAVEASSNPERALPMCARLENLMPGAGHLVHMPSHIYARTARYADAQTLNERAAGVDEKYIAEQKPQGAYPLMYYTHNLHFIWFTASMQGRSADALVAARRAVANVPPPVFEQMPMLQDFPPLAAVTLAHFGRWDEALAEPVPPVKWRHSVAMSSYARGRAFVGKGDLAAANAALDTIHTIAVNTPGDFYIRINPASMLLRIAENSLAGAIAIRQNHPDDAVKHLQLAVAGEDSLHYDEPPTWYFPARHELGAALMAAGRAADAEAVYREDLRRHPENGWSLFGLEQALRAQGRTDDATATDARFKKAWTRADIQITATGFYGN
jgi:tetratricopeptide (TPR) repeat protein